MKISDKKIEDSNQKEMITIKWVLAMLCADIDIFLLRESDQETDKDKLFTTVEIREQLENSYAKVITALQNMGADVDKIIPTIKYI